MIPNKDSQNYNNLSNKKPLDSKLSRNKTDNLRLTTKPSSTNLSRLKNNFPLNNRKYSKNNTKLIRVLEPFRNSIGLYKTKKYHLKSTPIKYKNN